MAYPRTDCPEFDPDCQPYPPSDCSEHETWCPDNYRKYRQNVKEIRPQFTKNKIDNRV